VAVDRSAKIRRVARGRIVRFLAAMAAVALALLVRKALELLSITLPTYITFYPVVLLAALLGGMWAGILATALSAITVDVLLLAPIGLLTVRSTSDIVGLAIFSFSGVFISVVAEMYHRSQERLAAYEMQAAVMNERRKVEKERELAASIRAERQRFLEVLETLPTMISLLTPDHRIAFANRTFREKFGESQGRHCFEARFGRSTPCDFCESYTVLETNQAHHWEMILEDGSLIEAYNYPFTDLDGSSLILEMDIDITERRRAETELKQHREDLEALVTERTHQLQSANKQLLSDVRERELAEQSLRESKAKLQAALASMKDSVIIADADGKFVDFNDAYAAFYRFNSKDECARDFDEFATMFDVFLANGAQAPREMYAIQRALRGETATNAEYTLLRKDTGERWIGSLSFGPIRDGNGEITGAVVTSRDITEAKKAEEALQESEAQFRNLANAIPQLCWMANTDGWIFWYNARWYEYTGTTPEMMEGWGWQSVHDQDALPQVLERWKVCIATGSPLDMVFPLRGADGVFRPFLTRVMPVKDSDGKVVRWFGTNTDISEQKQIEAELRKSRERLDLALDVANLGEWERDLTGHTASRSLRHAQIFGYSSAESDWSFEKFLQHVLPEHRAEVKEPLRKSEAGGTTEFETQIQRLDGEVRWIWVRSQTELNEIGQPSRAFGIVMDITERKKVEEALRRSEKEAFQRHQLQALAVRLQQVREEERKRVARDLHDQIGQILTAIKMDMTWSVRHLPPLNGELHNRLMRSIELANEGVKSVRKICSGLRPGILDDLGLAAAIEWQANEFASRTKISCQVTLPPGDLRLDGDRTTAIFRIFQECLTNIARHAEAQSVHASLCEQNEVLVLIVQDDGKGFRESDVAGSLGILGMKERAQACGGSVQVSSSPGKGTTVSVRVPVHPSGAEQEDNAYSDSR
jgi:PAS domain S-box-containing protein